MSDKPVEIADLVSELTCGRVNHDLGPSDTGMWIQSVTVFRVLRTMQERLAVAEAQMQELERENADLRDLGKRMVFFIHSLRYRDPACRPPLSRGRAPHGSRGTLAAAH